MPASKTKKTPAKRSAGARGAKRATRKAGAAKRSAATNRSAKASGGRKSAARKTKSAPAKRAHKAAKPSSSKGAKGRAKTTKRAKKGAANPKKPKAKAQRSKRAPAKRSSSAKRAPKSQAKKVRRSATGEQGSGPLVAGAAAERPVKPSSRTRGARDDKPVVAHRRTREKTAGRRRKSPKGGALTTSVDPPRAPGEKRSFGLRGAAPWVARHAAKHAEELRKRNAQPPPPGSARATLRVPPEAEQIKATVAQLHQLTSKIRSMCRKLDKHFYEVGELLADIQLRELHIAKGYSNFESFLDRETDLGRANALRLIRISHTFLRETAYDYGIDRLAAALAALDGDIQTGSPSQPSSSSFSSPALPAKAPIRYNE